MQALDEKVFRRHLCTNRAKLKDVGSEWFVFRQSTFEYLPYGGTDLFVDLCNSVLNFISCSYKY